MLHLLVILGFILLIGGAIAVVVGHFADGRAVSPGWAAVILGVIFLLVGWLVPQVGNLDDGPDGPDHAAGVHQLL